MCYTSLFLLRIVLTQNVLKKKHMELRWGYDGDAMEKLHEKLLSNIIKMLRYFVK